jgi:hypothetical protein
MEKKESSKKLISVSSPHGEPAGANPHVLAVKRENQNGFINFFKN